MTEGKSKIIGGLFWAMAGAGLIRICWAYLKDGSLKEAVGITLLSLALAAYFSWIRSSP